MRARHVRVGLAGYIESTELQTMGEKQLDCRARPTAYRSTLEFVDLTRTQHVDARSR